MPTTAYIYTESLAEQVVLFRISIQYTVKFLRAVAEKYFFQMWISQATDKIQYRNSVISSGFLLFSSFCSKISRSLSLQLRLQFSVKQIQFFKRRLLLVSGTPSGPFLYRYCFLKKPKNQFSTVIYFKMFLVTIIWKRTGILGLDSRKYSSQC
jgi:hypothetical protein